MTWRFLEEARGRLGLTDEEVGFLHAGGIRSYDEFHAVLAASPSLDTVAPRIRRAALLGLMLTRQDCLSTAYRTFLDTPRPMIAVTDGANLVTADEAAAPRPVPDWPAPADGRALGTMPPPWPNLALSDRHRPLWPPRDQLGQGTCIGFAAGGAMERAWMAPGARAPALLSAIYLYNRSRAHLPPGRQPVGAANGASRLEGVKFGLPVDGVCPEPDWPDGTPPHQPPSAAAMAKAVRTDRLAYWDLSPKRVIRPAGVARVVFDLLAAGVPVAAAAPLFRDPAAAPGQDNWNYDYAAFSGKVADPQPGWQRLDLGHAVAVLAFQADATEPSGGWFIFRNSRGIGWATNPDIAGIGPLVPERGYGAMSATYMETHVWELLAVLPGHP